MNIPDAFVVDLVRVVFIMTLSGSALALILLAIKPLVRRRLPQAVQYGLWLIVLAALLIPVSMFIVLPGTLANVSLAPVHAVIEQTVIFPAEEMSRTLPVMKATGAVDVTGAPAAADIVASHEKLPASPPGLFAKLCVGFLSAYPLAALFVLFYYLFGYAYFLGKIRCRRPVPLSDVAVINRLFDGRPTPPVFLCQLASTPMLVGLFRPMIILPDREYTAAQLKTIMMHELTHMRRFDVVVKWLTVLACALHWFNPVVWLARREINRSCELSCDAAVIRNMTVAGKKNYGCTLLSLASDPRAPRAVLATTMCEEKKALNERLTSIIKYRQHKRITIAISILVLVAAAGTACVLGSATRSVSAGEMPGVAGNVSDEEIVSVKEMPAAPVQFTVMYNYAENGGSYVTTATDLVNSGEEVDLTPRAEKGNGWIFVGWNTDKDAAMALTSCTMPSSDVTLYAIYRKTLTATLKDYSGKFPTTPPRTASVTVYNKAADGVVIIPAPGACVDWESRGWSANGDINSNATVAVVSGEYPISGDVTLYALYRRDIIVSFADEDGTPVLSPRTLTVNANSYDIKGYYAPLTLPAADAVSRPDRILVKWRSSLSGAEYNPGETRGLAAVDVTFTAVWEAAGP